MNKGLSVIVRYIHMVSETCPKGKKYMEEKIMKKTMALVLIGACVLGSSALAEQPKAAEYRKFLQSGNFQLEYGFHRKQKMTLVAENGNRGLYRFITAGGIVGMAGGGKTSPYLLFRDGKYYQFESNQKAVVATQQNLLDENIDPRMNWTTLKYWLGVPQELVPLMPYDNFRANNAKANFVESGKKMTGKKEMVYDKYTRELRNAAGVILGCNDYYYYYDEKGELDKIETVYKAGDNESKTTCFIGTFKGEVDEKFRKMPDGLKVYAVGLGDMDDLLEKTPLVEEYKSSNAKEGGEK